MATAKRSKSQILADRIDITLVGLIMQIRRARRICSDVDFAQIEELLVEARNLARTELHPDDLEQLRAALLAAPPAPTKTLDRPLRTRHRTYV